jgi:hypothetical protein
VASAQALKLTPSNTKETSESLWQEKYLTIRLCAATMLQLKTRTKAHTEHVLFVCPYASTEISYSPWPALYFPTTPTLDGTFLNSAMWTRHSPMHNTENSRPSVVTQNPLSCDLTSMNNQNHMLPTVVIGCWLFLCFNVLVLPAYNNALAALPTWFPSNPDFLQEKEENRSNLHTCRFLLSTILPKMTARKIPQVTFLKRPKQVP